jgi:hypothetical protein
VGGFCGDGSGYGTYGEPFCGASYAAQDTSPFGGAYGLVSLLGYCCGLGLFIAQVAPGGCQLAWQALQSRAKS